MVVQKSRTWQHKDRLIHNWAFLAAMINAKKSFGIHLATHQVQRTNKCRLWSADRYQANVFF